MPGTIERNVGNLHDQDTGKLTGYRNPVTNNEEALDAAALQTLVSTPGNPGSVQGSLNRLAFQNHAALWCDLLPSNILPAAGSVRDSSGVGNDFVRGTHLTNDRLQRSYETNRVISSPALTASGTGVVTGGAASTALVQGVPVTMASGAAMPALTGYNLTAGQHGLVLFYVDRAGVYTITTATPQTQGTALTWAETPADKTLIGWLRISATGVAFTGGTTALTTGGGITVAFDSPANPVPAYGRFFGPVKASTVTNLDAAGVRDTALHGPSMNFDYDGGEALLVVMTIRAAVPASNVTMIGNADSSSLNGWRLRMTTGAKVEPLIYSATGAVTSAFGSTIGNMIDNTWHQVAVMVDGRNKVAHFWEDGALTRTNIAGPATCDTRESAGLHIGSGRLVPNSAATDTSEFDIARLTIFRWGAADTIPSAASLTAGIAMLRRDLTRTTPAGDF